MEGLSPKPMFTNVSKHNKCWVKKFSSYPVTGLLFVYFYLKFRYIKNYIVPMENLVVIFEIQPLLAIPIIW